MRLSNKVLITLSVIWIFFLGLVYLIGHEYLIKSYMDLEKIEIQKNVNRYHQHVNEILATQGALAVDWGWWNDAHDFLAKPTQKFIDDNFDYATFENLHLSLIMYIDKKGKVVYGQGADLQEEKLVPYTKEILKYLTPDSPLVKHTDDPARSVTGLVSLPSGLMLIVAAPVAYLYNEVTKPITGAVIMGRYFSQDLKDKTAKAISIPLVIYMLDQIKGMPNLEKIYQSALSQESKIYVDFLNNEKANVYSVFYDINHQPIGMVELFISRDIYFAGVKSTNYYLSIFMILGLISGVLIWFLLKWLVLNRVEDLNKKIVAISQSKDYSHRITVSYQDEISFLATQFNNMMGTIQESHGQLSFQIQLLQESEKRLEALNAKLKEEINERIRAQEKVAALQSKLLFAARRAGMADIASGILHNIGNILNSVVTSIGMIREREDTNKITKIDTAVKLLEENPSLKQEAKIQEVSNYLSIISKSLQEDKTFVLNEIAMLDKNMNVIKNVVSNQQSASEALGIVEKVEMKQLVEDALAVNKPLYENTPIQIIEEFDFADPILIDRVKLLHILVNLFKNSIESVLASENQNKIITIRIQKQDDNHIILQVIDNGVGIEKENLDKIFTFGFTTKKTGHGFGMHTSANFSNEIGGKLSAESAGLDQGATISLVLPISPEKKIMDAFAAEFETNH